MESRQLSNKSSNCQQPVISGLGSFHLMNLSSSNPESIMYKTLYDFNGYKINC